MRNTVEKDALRLAKKISTTNAVLGVISLLAFIALGYFISWYIPALYVGLTLVGLPFIVRNYFNAVELIELQREQGYANGWYCREQVMKTPALKLDLKPRYDQDMVIIPIMAGLPALMGDLPALRSEDNPFVPKGDDEDSK